MEGSVLGGSIAGGPSFASRFRTTAMGCSTGKILRQRGTLFSHGLADHAFLFAGSALCRLK
jgi:hypothetical protein